jgi:hypothetical protein
MLYIGVISLMAGARATERINNFSIIFSLFVDISIL